MKKVTKIVLISAVSMGVLGGVLFGAGVVAGGNIDLVYDGNHLAGTPLFRRLVHGLQHHEHRYEEMEDRWEEHWDTWENEWESQWNEGISNAEGNAAPGSMTYPQTEVEALLLEVDTGIAEIRMTNGQNIQVRGIGEDDTISYSADDRELYIEAAGDHDRAETKLLIEVPESKKLKNLELISDTAEIKVLGKLQAERAYLETDTGNLQAELLDCGKSEVECSTGNLQVKYTGKLSDYAVHAENDSGSLVLDGKTYIGYQEGVFGNADSKKIMEVSNDTGNLEIAFESK